MEEQAEKSNFGLSGPVFRVMPKRDRVRHFRRENWFRLTFMVAWTSFAAWGVTVVPRAIITGKPARVNGTTVTGWSSVNGDVIMFQCVATMLFGVGVYALRHLWLEGRRNAAAFPQASEREWTLRLKDHQRLLIVDGFGISESRRRLSIDGRGPSPKRVVLALPSPHMVVTIDGEIKANVIINPSSENSSDLGVEIDIEPGAEAVVFARVDRPRSARRNSKWTLDIGLLGDPDPPEHLIATWSDDADALKGKDRNQSLVRKAMGGTEIG